MKGTINMTEYQFTKSFSNIGTRNEVRMRVVNELSKEIPGQGTGDLSTKCTYFVENMSDNETLVLRRPARTNHAFDFTVRIYQHNFANSNQRKRTNPTHGDLLADLSLKKNESASEYKKLFEFLLQVYECSIEADNPLINKIHFKNGLPIDYLTKLFKWLFIEQDIAYWSYSGRQKLWQEIKSI